MEYCIYLNGDYRPITYVTRPVDQSWNQRESIEVNSKVNFNEAKDFFKGGKWSIFEKRQKEVYDTSDEGLEKKSHYETEYVERDMSEYCVCGWIRDNVDGSCSIKMGKLSELEKFIETTFGGML